MKDWIKMGFGIGLGARFGIYIAEAAYKKISNYIENRNP